jgi:uncharacterized protein YjgD (DUF1641 family)|tara:strand:+ start:333 stop:764 length:432 start_codon:yes stop_codon:yes gene_type:complete
MEKNAMNELKETDANLETQNLDKLIELASAIAAAQDAMTDDIVTRLAAAIGEGMILMDRVTRNEGLMHLLQALGDPAVQENLEGVAKALTSENFFDGANDQKNTGRGGYLGLMRLLSDSEVQDAIYTLAGFLKKFNAHTQKNS